MECYLIVDRTGRQHARRMDMNDIHVLRRCRDGHYEFDVIRWNTAEARFERLRVVDRVPEGGSGKVILPVATWEIFTVI